MVKVAKVLLMVALVAFGQSAALAAVGTDLPATNCLLDAATRKEAEATLARGVAWLQAQQGADGRIGTNQHVAVTALALRAARGARVITNFELRITNGGGVTLEKADGFLKGYLASSPTNVGWAVFNGEVCRAVLKLPPSKEQVDWVDAWARQDQHDSARAREFELREIAWQKQRAELVKKGADPDRVAAASLAQSCAVNGHSSVVIGGSSNAGSGGLVAPALPGRRRGYGSLTYDGMMRLLYDDVRRNDPRVDAMLDWAERGWSLEENPGKGKAGLYYFWHAMSKCLAASGEEEIVPLQGGAAIRWREEFVHKLIALQHVDADRKSGYWVNENQNFMEDDPVLVTAYAMLSLECVLGRGR